MHLAKWTKKNLLYKLNLTLHLCGIFLEMLWSFAQYQLFWQPPLFPGTHNQAD